MNKKKIAVLTLLMVAVMTLTSCLFVACDKNTTPNTPAEKATATEGLLITNGDFKVVGVDSEAYPRTLDGWTGQKTYSTSTFREDVTAGAISLDKALYDANKSAWDGDSQLWDLLNEGDRFKDRENKNALMVYMPVASKDANGNDAHGPTAYGYTSTSFTLDKGSYYKLSVDVLTYKIAGDGEHDDEAGARIYVSTNTYAEISGIKTEGWETYEIYIETSPVSTTSLSVQLSLGKATSSYQRGLTTGYAFFDNLSLKKLVNYDVDEDEVLSKEKVADPAGKYADAVNQQLDDVAQNKKSHVTTATLKVPNGGFEFGSSTVASNTAPNSWSIVTGNSSSKDDPAPTNLARSAIVDVSRFAEDYEKFSATYNIYTAATENAQYYNPAEASLADLATVIQNFNGKNRAGTNVFMLTQALMGASGIRSSRSITIEKGKLYALSIDVFTTDVHGGGVSLVLTGSDGKDIKIEGISQNKSDDVLIGRRAINVNDKSSYDRDEVGASTDGWRTYYFYIKGNDYSDYSYNMEIWLGTEGTNSNSSVDALQYTKANDTTSSKLTTYRANGTFSNGWVFVDELLLKEIDNTAWDAAVGDTTHYANNADLKADCGADDALRGIIVDLADNQNQFVAGETDLLDTGTGNSSFEGTGYVEAVGAGAPAGWVSHYDVENKSNPVIEGVIKEGVVNLVEEGFQEGIGDYPGLPYDNLKTKKAYVIYSGAESYYEVESQAITIKQNKFYRISFWLKTVGVSETSGAYVYVLNKTEQAESDDPDAEVQATSYTRINTADSDDYYNDWVEIKLVVRGSADSDKDIALKFALGYGNKWAASTLTKGAMYVANFNMTEITYANYTGTSTGTYTKSINLSNSYTYTFTNGNFDGVDLDDENYHSDPSGKLSDQEFAIAPENWTINDETLEINDEDADRNKYAGVLALEKDEADTNGLKYKGSNQTNAVTGLADAFFNNFYNTDADLSDDALKAVAGPNILAIGVKEGGAAFAAGYASASFTLSANTYNVLSVYAKTTSSAKASIFLTGEASATNNAGESSVENSLFRVSGADTLTKYTFYIRVGKASVSLKLNLWLGYDKQYTSESESEVVSTGAVFFDNVYLGTIDEDEFDASASLDTTTNKTISFITDSFDALSSTVESRGSLSTPNGWTGSADTDQSSSNTLSGIAYADSNYYESKKINEESADNSNAIEVEHVNNKYPERNYDMNYVKFFGKSYTDSDVSVTDEERDLAKNDPNYEYYDPSYADIDDDARIVESIRARKLQDKKFNNWLPIEYLNGSDGDAGAHSGNSLLVINNTAKSAYTYTSASNTFANNSYYKVSVWVRTYGLNPEDDEDNIDERAGAYIELYLGSANDSDKPLRFEAINAAGWTQYTFYVHTLENDVTSVTVKLSLGKYFSDEVDGDEVITGLTSGYAMFDDVSIDKVEQTEYEAANPEENDKVLVREVSDETSGSADSDDGGETETPARTFNLTNLWWMIPTIVLGLIIIIAVVVVIVRRVYKPGKRGQAADKPKKTSTPQATESLDEKNKSYDEDNE